MKKLSINKTKCFLASLSLLMTLQGCSTKNIEESVEPTIVEETETIDIENIDEVYISKNQVFEIDLTKDNYSLDKTYINFIFSDRVDISNYRNHNAEKSISLEELISDYNYQLEYDEETNTITKDNLKKIVDDFQTRYKEITNSHKMRDKIYIDEITIFDAVDLKDGKLYCLLFMNDYDYNKYYNSLTNEENKEKAQKENQKYEIAKYNFCRNYKEYIKEDEERKYISNIDYVLLNGSISYTRNIEEMFNKISPVTKEEIAKYKLGVLKKYNININNNKLRFDPNNLEDIDTIINNYVNSNLIDSYLKATKEKNNIDYTYVALDYIALNNDLLTDDTISKITSKYISNDYKKCSPEQIKDIARTCYKVDLIDELLVANEGYYEAFKTYTDYYKEADNIELPTQVISSDNHKKACEELYLLNKVYNDLKHTNPKDMIIDELVNIFIDIDKDNIQKVNIPNSMFEPNERDYTWLYIMLLDDYQNQDIDSLYNNFDIALKRIEESKIKEK